MSVELPSVILTDATISFPSAVTAPLPVTVLPPTLKVSAVEPSAAGAVIEPETVVSGAVDGSADRASEVACLAATMLRLARLLIRLPPETVELSLPKESVPYW